jgi:predicted dehydrogenase/type 1 glutamine amidotransferase
LIRTLVVAGRQQVERLAPWLDYLARTGSIAAEVTQDCSALTHLDGYDVVVAHSPEGGLEAEAESSLCDFVSRGGGFLGLHCTNANWASSRRYLEMVGGSPDGRLPQSEIVTRVSDGSHDITRRLTGSLTLHDSCYTRPEPPPDSRVLLDTSWQSRRLPVAYLREAGAGRVFYWGMGEAAATFREPEVQELLYRALRYAAGEVERDAVGVGMLGFGAIGADHVASIEAVAGLRLRAVCDQSQERLDAARGMVPELEVAGDLAQLLELPEVELVVISTPPNTHAKLAEQALRAGKHVLVEKPFCLNLADADRLVALAEECGRTLTVYQNRRWDPDFLALQSVVRRGDLGSIFHLEAFVGGYHHPCHFWHSHSPVSGGVIFDWGSHYLDWILQLIPGEVAKVSASRQKLVWQDVTNDDHFELRMTFASGAEAEFIHSDIAAARKPKWYVLGTRGAAVGHWREGRLTSRGPAGQVVEERLPVTDLPCELHVLTPDGSGECHDQLVSLPSPPPQAFYRNLAGHLLAQEPLAVSPESARRNVAVMEAATRSAALGKPLCLAV